MGRLIWTSPNGPMNSRKWNSTITPKRPDFIRRKLSGDWPTNYALTYSYSERADMGLLVDYLESGGQCFGDLSIPNTTHKPGR
jgi:hypothetical protein